MNQDKLEAVTVNGGGLKCDTEGCDWSDPDISMANYASYVGYECPKCSACVLTQDDYDALQMVLTLVGEINAIAEALPTDQLIDVLGVDPDLAELEASLKIECVGGEVIVHEPKLRTN